MAWTVGRKVWMGAGLFAAGLAAGLGLPLALIAQGGLAWQGGAEKPASGVRSVSPGGSGSPQPGDPPLRYRIASQVAGRGFESIGAAPVSMAFQAVYALDTLKQRAGGGRTLSLEWEDVSFAGDFMAAPFQMRRRGDHASMSMNGRTYVDTARGVGSAQGLPQLAFFGKPIEMEVDAGGVIKAVRGPAGFDALLPALSPGAPEPAGDRLGARWTSQVSLPIPGLGQPVEATLINEIIGYQDVAGRRCAVVRQDWTSTQHGGSLDSPESVLGEAMGFSMPLFDVQGVNMIYSDVQTGDLVRSDLGLRFVLRIGQALGNNEMHGGLPRQLGGGLFGGLAEGLPEFGDMGAQPQDLLKLEVDIRGAIELLADAPARQSVQPEPAA